MTVADRLWPKIDTSGGLFACWPWLGATNLKGYGSFWVEPRNHLAHRVVYELTRGAIPDGLQIDHLCRNPRCVNPAHMEVVTSRENTLRGDGATARHARQTHCKRGHLLVGANLRYTGRNDRDCLTCFKAYQATRGPHRSRTALTALADALEARK